MLHTEGERKGKGESWREREETKKKKDNPRKNNCIVNTMEYPDSMAALMCPTVCRSPAGERASQPGLCVPLSKRVFPLWTNDCQLRRTEDRHLGRCLFSLFPSPLPPVYRPIRPWPLSISDPDTTVDIRQLSNPTLSCFPPPPPSFSLHHFLRAPRARCQETLHSGFRTKAQ